MNYEFSSMERITQDREDMFAEVDALRSKVKALEGTIVKLENEIFWLMSMDGEGVDRNISIKTIAEIVCARTGFNIMDFRSGRRSHDLSRGRHIFAYFARSYTQLKLKGIGRFINKDHTSVLHGIRKIEQQIKTDESLNQLVREIDSDIRQIASSS